MLEPEDGMNLVHTTIQLVYDVANPKPLTV